MASDKRGHEVHDAIARRDAASLRQMAAAADREEGRMWLTLLARMLELDAGRRRRPRTKLGRLVLLTPARRTGMKRAV